MTKSEFLKMCEGLSAEELQLITRLVTVLNRDCKTAENMLDNFLQEARAATPGNLPRARFVSIVDAMERAADHEAGQVAG